MAIVTKLAGEFFDPGDGSRCAFEYDYDDGTLRVTAFRCINDCPSPAFGTVARASNPNVRYEAEFAAQSTFEIGVSNGAAQRLQLTVTPSGKLDGIQFEFRYPAVLG